MNFDNTHRDLALEQVMKKHAHQLVAYLDHHFAKAETAQRLSHELKHQVGHDLAPGLARLLESMRYSLLQDGGKRFRPVLAMMVGEALGKTPDTVMPIAAAVECVHTYSLIHDDLPAMDNDDFRRGAPTNHKKFDESTAILAGDALLTEAFLFLSLARGEAALALQVVGELARAAGLVGMVGGQAIDIRAKAESITIDELKTMHRLKTGALIRVSAVGAALLAQANPKQVSELTTYADCLGLAFQVADDILDYDPVKIEPGSYPALLGIDQTRRYLDELTQECLASLASWSAHADALRALAVYNLNRKK